MMKSKIAILLLFAATGADAAVKCQIRAGSGCGGPVIYEMQLCAEVTFNQNDCLRDCRQLKPICEVEGFDAWVDAYRDRGRGGISGELIQNSDAYDDQGALAYTSGKTYSVCLRTKRGVIGSYSSPQFVTSRACSRVNVASAESCRNGTIFNPATGQCEIQDPSCGSGSNSTISGVIQQGQMLVGTQNNHFSTNAAIDPNQVAISIRTTPDEGLQSETKAPAIADVNFALPRRNVRSGGNTGSPGALGATGGTGGFVASSGGEDSKKAENGDPSMLASTYLAGGEQVYGQGNGDAGNGGAGATGSGGFGGSESGMSWFGSKTATPGDGAAGEVGFDANGASRGLASSSSFIDVEDPADYFMRAGLDTSLFKRVTAQCRKKEKELVLAR